MKKMRLGKKLRSRVGRTAHEALQSGNKQLVTRLVIMLNFIRPRDRGVTEFQIKALLTHPVTTEQANRAADVATRSVRHAPTQRGVIALSEAILAKASHDVSTSSILKHLDVFDELDVSIAVPGLRLLATGLIDRGHNESSLVLERMSQVVRQEPTQRGVIALSEAILAKASHDVSTSSILKHLDVFDELDISMAFPGLRLLATGLIDRGHNESSLVLERMTGVNHRAATIFVHASMLRFGQIKAAARLAHDSRQWPWMTETVFTVLEADRALANRDPIRALALLETAKYEQPNAFDRGIMRSRLVKGDFERLLDQLQWMTKIVLTSLEANKSLAFDDQKKALSLLESLTTHRSSSFSRSYVTAAASAGRYERLLEYLDTCIHNLSPTVEAQFRFEANWALGKASAATAALAQIQKEDPLNPHRLRYELRLLALEHNDAVQQMIDRTHELEHQLSNFTTANITKLMACYEQLGCVQDVVRLAASVPNELLGPGSLVHVAKAQYFQRDFESALATLQILRGLRWRWDGDKLAARIQLEMGNASEALKMRAHRRPTSELDEVELHALLALGRFNEAFDLYLAPGDRQRLKQLFPVTAHLSGTLKSVDHRVIVMQSGPGDEIMLASLYAEASRYSKRMSATCEPRLEPLLRNSFPSIEFIPVRRLKSDDFGWRRDWPDRSEAEGLGLLLDDKALKVAKASDSVVMGRSLPSALGSARLPSAPYLRPSDEASARVSSLHRGRPLIGVAWRSEVRSPMRNIHYLEVSDLGELLPEGVDVICLQHDATAEELETLESMTKSLIDLQGIDLRNDFDSAAAVVNLCDVVVGIGTTIVELAGAVGTKAVLVQPTHFGTWRAQADDQDFWHRSMVVSAIDEPWNRIELIAKARAQLDLLLDSQ